MGRAKKHQPLSPVRNSTLGKSLKPTPNGVKLIIGFIFQQEDALNDAESSLERQFGEVDFKSPVYPFSHTTYYEKELGQNLRRKFISFHDLILPESLPKIKIVTNRIEKKLSRGVSRRINIDPGYLDLSRLVLATTKDYKHRIYLNRGIYAEITLFYQGKSFKCWEWTYPDYKTSEYIAIFNHIRSIYAEQIKPQK